MKRDPLRIGGQRVGPQGANRFETQNPCTAQAWSEIPQRDARDVDTAAAALA